NEATVDRRRVGLARCLSSPSLSNRIAARQRRRAPPSTRPSPRRQPGRSLDDHRQSQADGRAAARMLGFRTRAAMRVIGTSLLLLDQIALVVEPLDLGALAQARDQVLLRLAAKIGFDLFLRLLEARHRLRALL